MRAILAALLLAACGAPGPGVDFGDTGGQSGCAVHLEAQEEACGGYARAASDCYDAGGTCGAELNAMTGCFSDYMDGAAGDLDAVWRAANAVRECAFDGDECGVLWGECAGG